MYLHIPFCLKKCNYCDFCSFPSPTKEEVASYLEALKREILEYKEESLIPIDTLYIGGGTPSLLSVFEFESIVKSIREVFLILPECEFTVEANPKTLTPEKVRAYRELGVNRISIGLQSIHKNEQKILGRVHDYDDFLASYNLCVEGGIKNINVDVMYAIPAQTLSSFEKTLDAVLSLRPNHISAYSLIVEDGTPFGNQRESLGLPNESEELEMYALLIEKLRGAGYSHYEISAYAKDGFLSRHNLRYWHAEEYIGIGLSAYSYYRGVRFGNTKRLDEYLSEDYTKYRTCERLCADDLAFEYAMLHLRLSDGISLSEYESRFGKSFASGKEELIHRLVDEGLVRYEGDRLSLTERGFYVSNELMAILID